MTHMHVHHHEPVPPGDRDHPATGTGAAPARSLLLMSAGQRLGGAAVLLALMWAAVLWALG